MKKNLLGKLMILAAAALLCWPAVSHVITAARDARAIGAESSSAEALDQAEYAEALQEARQYNDLLAAGAFMAAFTDETHAHYETLMNLAGNGVMGRVSVPKIKVELPIYHGTTDAVMQKGVGHMEGTSLPVESKSSHIVLSGHSGMALSPMFTELPQLEVGDTFQITALGQTLTYEVDNIQVVWPEDTDAIVFEPGKEYCTLLTCTPPGVNNKRLLVRGCRIETPQEAKTGKRNLFLDILRGKVLATYEIILLGLALLLIAAGFLWPLIHKKIEK